MSSLPTGAAAPVLADGVTVGEGVRFGAFVVVHAGTVIGDGCTIGDHAVLGRQPRRSARAGEPVPLAGLELSAGASVGAGAIVCAGARIGADAILGDQSFVRERSAIGESSVIGRGSAVENDVRVGARVSVQTSVYLTAYTLIEDDVFVGPCVTTTNDDTMGRHAPSAELRGATLRRACRVGGGAVLTPGVELGEECFVAAGALVTADVSPRAVVMGVPARVVREVGEADLIERWR